MTSDNTRTAIVLRDREGNFYLISQDVLESHRVPEDKKQVLKQALSGDVAGYVLNDNLSQNAFISNPQTNVNAGVQNANAAGLAYIGGLATADSQLLNQVAAKV
ncbi:MAG TPA: hypothetical protein VFA70_09385 [Dehalococcoidia bacterium]|nr:hypothetical protein [Dehalococcoidia bacterium]